MEGVGAENMQQTLGTSQFEIIMSQNKHIGDTSAKLMFSILFTTANKEWENILGPKSPW